MIYIFLRNSDFSYKKTPSFFFWEWYSDFFTPSTSKKTRGNSIGKHLSRDFPTFPVVFLKKYSEFSG